MKREQAKDMNRKAKKGKRSSALDMEIDMEVDAEIDAGVSQQEGVPHMQIVKETAGAPAEDRSASALFVCSMCVSIKLEAVVLLRIYGENGLFLEAITLEPTNRSRNVFQAIVPITLHKPLRGRVAVSNGDTFVIENVVVGVGQGSWSFQDRSLRLWQCDSLLPVVLAAVVRDRFTNISAGFKNPVCTSTEHCEGWLRLLERLAAEFVCCSCIADFVSALARVVHQVQRADYGRLEHPDVPLTRPLEWLKAAGSLVRTSTLLQWMHLVKLAEDLAKVTVCANRDAFAALSRFDISDVWEEVVAEPADSPFRKTAAAFISRLLKESNWQDRIPWALLRLALSPDPAAKRLLQRWPLEAVPYLRLLQLPGTDPHSFASVLSCFPNLRVLRDSGLVLPAGVFRSIVDSPGYRMPSEPALALEEYGALMHFVLESDELLPHLATQRHLRVDSAALAGCSIEKRAEASLLPLVRGRGLPAVGVGMGMDKLVQQRCRDFREFLQPQALSADTAFVKGVYGVLRALVPYQALVPGLEQGIREIGAALPLLNCKGLVYRFVTYLREDDAHLLALEGEAFAALCRSSSSNDRAEMRKSFWGATLKVLDVNAQLRVTNCRERWHRAARILADLWEECYQLAVRGHEDALTPAERALLHTLGFETQGEEPALQFLMLQAVRDLREGLRAEAKQQPILLECPGYLALHDGTAQVERNILHLGNILIEQRLNDRALLVVHKHPQLYTSIKYVVPTFDEGVVAEAAQKVRDVTAELDGLLMVFELHMPKHPGFATCSALFVPQVQQLVGELEQTLLCDWQHPTLGGGQMRQLAHKLNEAQASLLYRWIWEEQCSAEVVVSADPSQAVQQWKEFVQLSLEHWQQAVGQIENQSFSKNALRAIVGPIIEDIPEAPLIPSNPVEARREADRHADRVAAHFESRVAAELDTTLRVLHGVARAVEKPLRDFVTAVAFVPQAEALRALIRSLCSRVDADGAGGAQVDPLGCFLHCMEDDSSTVGDATAAFLALRHAYQMVTRIVPAFPTLLSQLVEEGLLGLLKQYPEVSSLDQAVRRRIAETPGGREQELLIKVFEARQGLETDRVPQGYPALTGLSFPTAGLLVEYLHHVSWCISSLRPLLGGLRLLEGLLSTGGACAASTVAVVHALMATGEFILTVRDQDVQISATAELERDGRAVSKTFSPTQLGDIPFQLCMVGEQRASDGGTHLHFLHVIEHLKMLREALLRLAVSGHPNFQDRVLFVSGLVTLAELKELIEEQGATYVRWQSFLSSYADVHLPLLTCFSRKQLVESLGFVGRPECTEAAAHLLRTACPALPRSQALLLAEGMLQRGEGPGGEGGERGEGGSPQEMFAQVHQMLLGAIEYLVPPPRSIRALAPLIDSFSRELPDRLKPVIKVNVLRLPVQCAHQHSELVIALFISQKQRLPTPIEIFCCSPESTEQAAGDFLRRWAAAQHFRDMLPERARDLLFCMLNVEQLSAQVQGVLLGVMQTARKHNDVALLLVASVQKDSDSLLSSGLRQDLVPCEQQQLLLKHCLPVCAAFLKRALSKVRVYRSATASSGKTTAVIRDHLLGAAVREGQGSPAYTCVSITGNHDDAIEVLRAVEGDRLALSALEQARGGCGSLDADAGGLVLHLNVSSHFDAAKLNRFLLSFLVTGVLTDSKGGHIVRYATDAVAIEWPSEGLLAEHAWGQCRLLSCFNTRPVLEEFHLDAYTFHASLPAAPYMDCVLYHLSSSEDPQLRAGLQLALAFFDVDRESDPSSMPYCEDVPLVLLPEPGALFSSFAQQLATPDPAQPQTEIQASPGQVYRFMRFLSHQMHGLSNFAYYQFATREEDEENTQSNVPPNEHCRNHRRLAFHFARSCVHLARLLAASAVGALGNDCDDDARLSSLQFSFDSWRDTPFIIFTEDGDYSTISVTDTDILATMTEGDADPSFRAFIAQHQAGRVQSIVDIVTAGLTEDGYDPATDSSESHAIKLLLPMVSEILNHGTLIFRALQDKRLRERPGTTIAAMMHRQEEDEAKEEYHESAVQQLRHYAGWDGLQDADTFADFQLAAKQWLLSLKGSYDGEQAPFVLTRDNLIRLLTIKLRLICRVPVVFVGETGFGKTHLVSFLSKLSGQAMKTYNIYGGLKPTDVLAEMQGIVQRADDSEVVVLLDEINSSPNCWMLKMLLCDRSVLGRRIPSNIRFIAIMNPRRKRNVSAKVEAHGLDYSPYQRQLSPGTDAVSASQSALPLLVYEVHRCPESVMQLAWDFGAPSESCKDVEEALRVCHGRTKLPPQLHKFITDEYIFTENLVHWMVRSKLKQFKCGEGQQDEYGMVQDVGLSADFASCSGDSEGSARHYPYFRALLCALIDTSQRFMRTEQGLRDKSAASLRDISRVVTMVPFLMHQQERHAEFYPDPATRQHLYFGFLSVAMQTSLVLKYALRIVDEEQREEYLLRIHAVWVHVRAGHVLSPAFLPVPSKAGKIYSAFDGLASKLCSSLMRPKGIAINQALKENVLSLFCAVMGDDGTMFQFIVGRPGSTKSSSLDILCASTDPSSQDPRTDFFRGRGGWFSISKFLLQCTPDTTAQDILKLAHTAATAQRLNDKWRCIIVLEEVGVTLGSRHNPLMVLHNLIDRGVAMEDGSFVRLPIIGISNWQLDGSKMSRMQVTYRGNPSVQDLVKTAECIMEVAGSKVCAISPATLQRFATVFCNLILSDQEKEIAWFYGMRDFYAFIQFLQIHHAFPLSRELKLHEGRRPSSTELDPHLVEWAVRVSFGGHPDKALDERVRTEILRCFRPAARHQWVQGVRWARSMPGMPGEGEGGGLGHGQGRPHQGVESMCDMCARMAHYEDKQLAAVPLDAADGTRLFTDQFQEYQSIGCRCMQLDSASSFPATRVLAYCLNVYPAHLASKYRVRHVLLFTRTNAGLHLLFSLGLLRREQTTIIFGRSNASDADKLEDLLQVRRSMQLGRVLLLVDAHHISESLYDALNQHYTPEGKGENRVEYTRLTMNGYTASFPMNPSFRCISIAQEQSARSLLPPYINRFTKADLNYASALSVAQVNVTRSIRDKCIVVAEQARGLGAGGARLDLLKLLIPGLTRDTVDSLAFQLRVQREGVGGGLTMSEAVSVGCSLLSYCIVPRRLLQLTCGFFEHLAGDKVAELVSYWTELLRSRTHSLKEDYEEMQELRAQAGGTSEPPHLCLFTEQLQVCPLVARKALAALFPDCALLPGADFTNLRDVTDKHIGRLLEQLHEQEGGCYCCVHIDASAAGRSTSLLVGRFMHLVNSAQLADKHVVLICVLGDSSRAGVPADDVHLHYEELWSFMFIDQIGGDEEALPLCDLLSGEADALESVLQPHCLCSLIASRALPIAQCVERRDGVACSRLAALLLEVFSDPEDPVAQAVSCKIHSGLQHLGDKLWRRTALQKVSHARSLSEHLLIFLRGFAERALLQFSTALFSFKNFQTHCLPQSPTRELFVYLLQCPAILPDYSLATCAQVDLPLPLPLSNRSRSLLAGDSELFSDPSLPVQFPFSFLLAHILHPIARSSGRDACRQKAEEILQGLEGAPGLQDWAQLYTVDILTHTLKLTNPEAQRGFLFLACQLLAKQQWARKEVGEKKEEEGTGWEESQYFHLDVADDAKAWEQVEVPVGLATDAMDVDVDWEEAGEGSAVTLLLEELHLLLLEQGRWVEAAVRIVTAPGVDLTALYRSKKGLPQALLLAVSHSTGVVPLDAIADIETLIGERESYLLLLHQAVATATSQEDAETQQAAAELAWACSGDWQLLEKAFLRGDAAALRWSKFLLPVLFLSCEQHSGPLLVKLVDWLSRNFAALPLAASGSIVRRALDWWLKHSVQRQQDPELYPLVLALNLLVRDAQGVDRPLSVLVSRCLFDLCKSDRVVLDALNRVDSLAETGARAGAGAGRNLSHLCAVLRSGCVTAGLYLLAEVLKEELQAAEEGEGEEDEAHPESLLRMRDALQAQLEDREELAAAAALYTLRTLSSGGVEVDCAKHALRLCAHQPVVLLPTAVMRHSLCVELMREEESTPSALHLLSAYTKSMDRLLPLLGIREGEAVRQQCGQFEETRHSAAGVAASVLEAGFCRAVVHDSALDEAAQELLLTVVLPLLPIGPELRALCVALLQPTRLPEEVTRMKAEHRRAFVTAAVLILGADTPLLRPYRDIATAPGPPPHPQLPIDGDTQGASVSTYLLHAAHLVRLLVCAEAAPVDEVLGHREHIQKELLSIRCPRCLEPFDGFDACFAVNCAWVNCRASFCGWCFAEFPDAHAHVLVCPLSLHPGYYHGTHEEFLRTCSTRQLRRTKEYISLLRPGLRGPVLEACLTDLAERAIPLHELIEISGFTPNYCGLALKAVVEDTKANSFPDSLTDDPAVAYLQALLLLELVPSTAECDSIEAAQEAVRHICSQTPDAHALVDRLRADCQRAIGDASALLGVVCWDAAYEAEVQALFPGQLPHHFAYRTRATTQQFWHRVDHDPQFAVLSFLGVREPSLASSYGEELVTVLNKVGEIMRVCSTLQMTRAEAARTTLGELVQQFPELNADGVPAFGDAMRSMYDRVQRWECSDKAKLDARFGHLRFDDSLPLAYLLPHCRDEGLLVHVLYKGTADPLRDESWQSLGVIQNSVVKRLVDSCRAPSRSASHRPYALTPDDLVAFCKQKQMYTHLLALYIEPQPIATFTADLPNLQWQVLHSSGLCCKPTLADALPDFAYAEDQQHSVFGLLGSKVDLYGGVLPLSAPLLARLRGLVCQLAGSAQQVTSFLALLASELVSRPPFQTPHFLLDLACLVPIELTAEQRAGKALLSAFAKELRPQHILTLVEPLWDGALSPGCCVPLNDACSEAVEAALVRIVQDPAYIVSAAPLLSAFRMLGLQKLCVRQAAGFYEHGFIEALEAVAVGPDLPSDLLRGGAIEEVPTKHFEAVFRIADRVLGAAGLVPEGEENFEAEVTVEAMRNLFTLPIHAPPAEPTAPVPAPPLQAAPPPAPAVPRVPTALPHVAHRWEGRGNLINVESM